MTKHEGIANTKISVLIYPEARHLLYHGAFKMNYLVVRQGQDVILVFIVAASGVLFFLPSSIRDYLLMTEFYNHVGPFLGPVFIISLLSVKINKGDLYVV